MANPYLHKVHFDRGDRHNRTIISCKSLAKYIAHHLGLEEGQVASNKGTSRNIYIYFVKNNKLHTIVWDCWHTDWSEDGARQIVDFIKNLP